MHQKLTNAGTVLAWTCAFASSYKVWLEQHTALVTFAFPWLPVLIFLDWVNSRIFSRIKRAVGLSPVSECIVAVFRDARKHPVIAELARAVRDWEWRRRCTVGATLARKVLRRNEVLVLAQRAQVIIVLTNLDLQSPMKQRG
jgi:hypothetical protein